MSLENVYFTISSAADLIEETVEFSELTNEEHLVEFADDIVSSTNEENMDNETPIVLATEHDTEMSKMQLQLDRIEKKLDILIQKTNKEDEHDIKFEIKLSDMVKVNSLAALDDFERLLEDVSNGIKTSLLKQIKKNFEKSMLKYEGCQRKFAYDVIDTFTDREIFKTFSWKGKDAKNGEPNKCFENRTTYINFIFEAILSNDSKFKYEWLESIFNVLCRNKNSKTKRSSSTSSSHISLKRKV